ncbi:MAG: alpha/beta fold hydrolase [Cyanobacteria bacterium P01_H01_bin.121]
MPQQQSVILLHGLNDTASIFKGLRSQLVDWGYDVHAIDLTPCNAQAGLEPLAEQVAHYVNAQVPKGPLTVIGFSMGGIVGRYYLQRLDSQQRVNHLITIASPHHGSWAAYLHPGQGCEQMRPGSEFLTTLNQELPLRKTTQLTSIWSHFDLMILPATNSIIETATNLQIPVLLHPWMVNDARCIEAIGQALSQNTDKTLIGRAELS